MYRQGRRIDGIDVVDGDLPGTLGLADAVQKMADIAREEEESFAWIGLSQPTIEEIELMGQMFGLEHLYLEDSLNLHQPTKLDPQTDYDFIVMKILTYLDSTSDVETGQISVFIGEWFIVTIRLGPLASSVPCGRRWRPSRSCSPMARPPCCTRSWTASWTATSRWPTRSTPTSSR